jgi:hypothetical protein
VGIGPSRYVAGREDPRLARLQKGIDGDAAVNGQPCRFGEPDARPHANADDHEIGRQGTAAAEVHLPAVDAGCGFLQMEYGAMLFVQGANEVAHLRAQDTLHGALFRGHHMDIYIARSKSRGNLEPDEAGANHDRAARGRGACDDRLAVRERAQGMYVRLVGPGDG